ncbi:MULTISPECIES: hypothetical protein [Oceanobacillus]|nr:hypothetical protein [Oceanobacillus oncorhynchi]UUI39139.1 hypothetical protein NP440_17680 [Oceanobacillus oncorhynchi]
MVETILLLSSVFSRFVYVLELLHMETAVKEYEGNKAEEEKGA